MDSEMWQRVKRVVDPILETEPHSWPDQLFKSCGDDVDVFLQASTLLEASQRLGDFIEKPAYDIHKSHLALRRQITEHSMC